MDNKFDSAQLWDVFLAKFKQEVKKGLYKNDVDTNGKRTLFYKNLFSKLLENEIGKSLCNEGNLKYRKEEYSRVDHSLIYSGEYKWEVPIILIEVENNQNPDSNFEEIYKMCYLNAPLKLIFLCVNWPDMKYSTIDDYWASIIFAYKHSIGIVGTIGVFVLDISNDNPKYYYHKLVFNNELLRTELKLENLKEDENGEGIIFINNCQ
jgi:hypothetical protein